MQEEEILHETNRNWINLKKPIVKMLAQSNLISVILISWKENFLFLNSIMHWFLYHIPSVQKHDNSSKKDTEKKNGVYLDG